MNVIKKSNRYLTKFRNDVSNERVFGNHPWYLAFVQSCVSIYMILGSVLCDGKWYLRETVVLGVFMME